MRKREKSKDKSEVHSSVDSNIIIDELLLGGKKKHKRETIDHYKEMSDPAEEQVKHEIANEEILHSNEHKKKKKKNKNKDESNHKIEVESNADCNVPNEEFKFDKKMKCKIVNNCNGELSNRPEMDEVEFECDSNRMESKPEEQAGLELTNGELAHSCKQKKKKKKEKSKYKTEVERSIDCVNVTAEELLSNKKKKRKRDEIENFTEERNHLESDELINQKMNHKHKKRKNDQSGNDIKKYSQEMDQGCVEKDRKKKTKKSSTSNDTTEQIEAALPSDSKAYAVTTQPDEIGGAPLSFDNAPVTPLDIQYPFDDEPPVATDFASLRTKVSTKTMAVIGQCAIVQQQHCRN